MTLDSVAQSYVRLAVLIGNHDSDSIDYYYGPPELSLAARSTTTSLTEIQRQLAGLLDELHTIPVRNVDDRRRTDFLFGQLKALSCRVSSLSGSRLSFDEETRCYFGITVPADFDQSALANLQKKIDGLIPGKGTLVDRYAVFQSHFVIPPSRLPAVMKRAIQACRDQTLKHMALPPNEEINLNFTGNHPWAGYSLYHGGHESDVTINTDLPFTVDRALDLACHETYPGHHVFNMQEEDRLATKQHRQEVTVQPMYSPQSSMSEGAATIASMIAFSPEQRLRVERNELFPLAGLAATDVERYLQVESLVEQLHTAIPIIVRRYLDGNLEFARAGAMLEEEALMSNTFEALKYMNEFRTYVVTYTYLPDLLKKELPAWEVSGSETDRWNLYLQWMRNESTIVGVVH
jgi:hypothetical protein